jgi:hypothetical protein
LCARRLKDPRRIKTEDLRGFTHKPNNYLIHYNFASEKKLAEDARQGEYKSMRSTQTLQDRDASADSSAAEEQKGSKTETSLLRSKHHDQVGRAKKAKTRMQTWAITDDISNPKTVN